MLQSKLLEVGRLLYMRVPVPKKWKDGCLRLAYRLAGWVFRGERHYELWRRQDEFQRLVPQAVPASLADPEAALAALEWPQAADPLVSIVIAASGDFPRLAACLVSLRAHWPEAPAEVLVVAGAAQDPRFARLRDMPGLRCVAGQAQATREQSIQQAARSARGRYLYVLGEDTRVTAGWLDSALAPFARQPACGMVTPKVVSRDGRLLQAGGLVGRDGTPADRGAGDAPMRSAFNYVREVDYGCAAAFLASAEVFRAVGGFGEGAAPGLRAGIDLAYRMREAGWRVLYQPQSVVVRDDPPGPERAAEGGDPLPAREQPEAGATILVIDRYIPQPDRDAGSRSVWCVLQVLARMGLRIRFWPEDSFLDPAYVVPLQQLGIEVLYGAEFRGRFPQWIAEHGGQLDYVLLNRPLIACEFIADLRRHSAARLLLYGHDVHHLRLQREYELAGGSFLRWERDRMRALEQSLWRSVDVVYYPSSSETEFVRATVPGVRARTLPLYFFDEEATPHPSPERREGIVFVAGFGHGPNVDAAVWLVRAILPLVRASGCAAHLWLVGSNPPEEVRQLAGPDVTVTGYVTDERLLAFYRSARVAIVPLRIGAGVKGKVVEALHHGLPLVTTSVGAQGLPGLEAVTPVSDDAAELARQVSALLTDDAHWRAVSNAATAYVRGRFSREAMEGVLRQDIEPQGSLAETWTPARRQA